MSRDIVAIKLAGLADSSGVERVYEIVSSDDFDPQTTDAGKLELVNLRNSTTLDPFAKVGELAVVNLVGLTQRSRRGKEAAQQTPSLQRLILEGSLFIPELSLTDNNTEVAVTYNADRENGYYSIVASCVFRR